MAEIKITVESDDEKSRIELEAKKLGVSTTGFFRLLYRNWIGEITLEKKDGNSENKTKEGE